MGFNLEGFATSYSEEKVIAALTTETKRLHPNSKLEMVFNFIHPNFSKNFDLYRFDLGETADFDRKEFYFV